LTGLAVVAPDQANKPETPSQTANIWAWTLVLAPLRKFMQNLCCDASRQKTVPHLRAGRNGRAQPHRARRSVGHDLLALSDLLARSGDRHASGRRSRSKAKTQFAAIVVGALR